jgi:ABC-type polysaccharide/polyol phosphate export permease
MIESLVFALVGMLVFWLLMDSQLELHQYAIMIPYILLFAALVGNIIIFFSFLTDRTYIFMFLVLTTAIIIMFGSELFIDLSLFPRSVGMILRYFPTAQILHGLRQVIFSTEFNIAATAVPLVVTILLTYLNGELLKRKVDQ